MSCFSKNVKTTSVHPVQIRIPAFGHTCQRLGFFLIFITVLNAGDQLRLVRKLIVQGLDCSAEFLFFLTGKLGDHNAAGQHLLLRTLLLLGPEGALDQRRLPRAAAQDVRERRVQRGHLSIAGMLASWISGTRVCSSRRK